MADVTITSTASRDGVVTSPLGINFALARGTAATSGASVDTSSSTDRVGIAQTAGPRGGYTIHRGFFMFDCSDTTIGGHFVGTPEIAHAEIFVSNSGSETGSGGFTILKVDDLGGSLDTGDYGKIFTAPASTTINGVYSDFKLTIDGSWHILNSLARSDIETAIDSDEFFQCAIVSNVDYSDAGPNPGDMYQTFRFGDSGLNPPQLRLTFGTSGIWNGINF